MCSSDLIVKDNKAVLQSSLLAFCYFMLLAVPMQSLAVQSASAGEVSDNLSDKVVLKQNFHQAEITTVIEAIAKLTGRNFIIDPRVKGRVTLVAPSAMNPEDLYETLLSILRVHGYVAIPGQNAIKIVPANLARDQVPYGRDSAANHDWITEVISVHKVPANKLVAILRPLVAREGHLVALQESNKLIVTDSLTNIDRIKSILLRIDIDETAGHEVINIVNSSAESLATIIKQVMPPSLVRSVNVSFDERSNRIILAGDKDKRREIRALIAELDIKMPVEGKVQIIYLRHAKAVDLMPVLQRIAVNRSLLNSVAIKAADSARIAAGGMLGSQVASQGSSAVASDIASYISVEADERVNALIISAPPLVVTALKSVIRQLDIRRAQVLIEAIFVEISEKKAIQLGVEWGALGPSGAGLINFSGAIPALIADPATALLSASTGVTLAAGNVSANDHGWAALIKALHSDSGSNILATPSLLVLDNEEAEIVVGREVPFQTGSFTAAGNDVTNPFQTIERKNVGLSLKVKPQINEGDEVFLEIDKEVSDILPADGAVDLQTSKRQIKTRIIVGDGNVVVLGGLLSEKETEVERKIPGLGSIPGIGALFRSTEVQRERVNLMIFLRPVIIRNEKVGSFYSSKKYNLMHQEQGVLLEQGSHLMNDELRPRMPTQEQWQQQPATDLDSKQVIKQVEEKQEEPKKRTWTLRVYEPDDFFSYE